MSASKVGRQYAWLLRILPRAFRARYGDEMRRMFEEEWQETGGAARARLWMRALRGLAWTALVERASPGSASPAVTRGGFLTGLGPDVRAGVRGLARRPGFAATAILAIALGIAATTSVFTVVDAAILRGLPLPEPERLVSLWTSFTHQPGAEFQVSQAEFADVRTEVRGLERSGAWSLGETTIAPVGEAPARTVGVAYTVGDIYEIVGAGTVLGRLPDGRDDRLGAPAVVVLAHGLWQQQFGGDESVVGGDASVFGWSDAEIIGVLAPDVALPGDACGGSACASAPGVWVHWVQDPADWAANRSGHGLNAVGRLRAGMTLEGLRAELASLERAWAARYAGQHGFGIEGHTLEVEALPDRVLGTARRTALLLSAAALLLLVLACANVANLLLARGETRLGEVGLRRALGASPARVARPVLVEGVILGMAGGAAGLILSVAGLPLLLRLAPEGLRGLEPVTPHGRVVAFAALVALITGILFAVAPAWVASRREATVLLRASSGRGRTGATRGLRLLVAGQTALATVILTAAGLLTRSLLLVNAVDPGLDTAGRVAVDLRLSPTHHPTADAILGFYDQALQRVGALQGVQGAAVVRSLPLRDGARRENVLKEGETDRERRQWVLVQAASAGALDVLGVPLLEGRDIAATDRPGQPPVALVNATAARALWPGESAIGRRVSALFAPADYGLITIVGVFGDVRTSGLTHTPDPQLVLPLAQLPAMGWARAGTLVVRTEGRPAALVPALRATLAELDRNVPVENPTTMRDVLRASTARERFLSTLLGVFALMALVIAAVGVYAVVSFTVARQSREFAIRIALGARRSAILFGVLRGNSLITGAGALAGALTAALAAPALRAFLFDIPPRDVAVLAGVPVVLMCVALASSLIPALRATRVPPATVLQESE